jgi:hypothetical protein
MKSSILVAFFAVAALAGCSRDNARYEVVRTDKGVIRLDKKTGEMVAVSEYNVPSLIDTAALQEESEVDPTLSVVKAFPDFRLPGAKKVVNIKIQYRWMKGRMDYRMTVLPYLEELNAPLREKETSFTALLTDADGFEVRRFDAPFATLIKLVGASGKPEQWQAEDSFAISKSDFKRIVGITYTWRYSDGLEKVLNE